MTFILWLLFFIVIGSAGLAGLSAAPWLPTRKGEIVLIKRALKNQKPKVIYDLGSGDGRILFALAVDHPNTRLIGIEMSVLPYLISLIRKWRGHHQNVEIRFGNFFKHNLSDADIVITFLLDKAYAKLRKKFKTELDPEANILVEAWPYKEVKPIETYKEKGKLSLYMYQANDL